MITFQKLKIVDLPLMHKWLNTPTVIEWYEKKSFTVEEVKKKYLPRIEGKDPTDSYIIYFDEHPIGYIQTYMIDDYPDYAHAIQVESKSAGIDLFIGESDYLHKGIGPQILKSFLTEVVFTDKEINQAVVGPEPKNLAAIKAYEKTGFSYLKTVSVPEEDEPEYLMVINSSDLKSKD